MKKAYAVVLFLILAPICSADTFQVASGTFDALTENLSLTGADFTALGSLYIAGTCRDAYNLPGSPIMGCAGQNWLAGLVTITQGGSSETIGFLFDWMVTITQDSIQPVSSQTITEPATFSDLTGCVNEIEFPHCSPITLRMPSNVEFSVTFGPDASVESETYTLIDPPIDAPESSELAMLGIGFVFVAIRWCSTRSGRDWR